MTARHFETMILASLVIFMIGGVGYTATAQKSQVVPVDIFQVYELPIAVTSVELIRSVGTYELRCTVTSNANEKLLGFRYSLVAIDDDGKQAIINRSEAFALSPYETKRRTIRSPLNLKINANPRFVVMFEQVVGAESIWEVVKPKDALEAYLSGDYSIMPRVLRVANQVDAPEQLPLRVPY